MIKEKFDIPDWRSSLSWIGLFLLTSSVLKLIAPREFIGSAWQLDKYMSGIVVFVVLLLPPVEFLLGLVLLTKLKLLNSVKIMSLLYFGVLATFQFLRVLGAIDIDKCGCLAGIGVLERGPLLLILCVLAIVLLIRGWIFHPSLN